MITRRSERLCSEKRRCVRATTRASMKRTSTRRKLSNSQLGREYFAACRVSEGIVPDRGESRQTQSGTKSEQKDKDMSKTLVTLVLLCASLQAQVTGASIAAKAEPSVVSSSTSDNPVIEWNRSLLVILRTPGAQSPTIHSTRSFAILHASIFDAVNNIDGTYGPYLVRLSSISRLASQPAAADPGGA
jgi:hypothetical protein